MEVNLDLKNGLSLIDNIKETIYSYNSLGLKKAEIVIINEEPFHL